MSDKKSKWVVTVQLWVEADNNVLACTAANKAIIPNEQVRCRQIKACWVGYIGQPDVHDYGNTI